MISIKKVLLALGVVLTLSAGTTGCDKKRNATVMYQLNSQTPQQMMSYVILTKDNSCIVIDGGNTGDNEYLLKFLKEKTGMKKPVVDAWIFSHVHSDHVNAFIALVNDKQDKFTVKKLYYNFPTGDFILKYDYTDTTVGTLISFESATAKLTGTEHVILKNGDKFNIDDLEFEVLLVQDESANFMKNSNVVNNSSSIFRMTAEGQTVLFLGDAGVEQGRVLLETYGDRLKSDMVQMAHHGQNGVEENVYQAINPSVCLWTAPAWLYENDNGGGFNSGPWKTVVVRDWMEKLDVKHHFVDKDGLAEIKFPFDLD